MILALAFLLAAAEPQAPSVAEVPSVAEAPSVEDAPASRGAVTDGEVWNKGVDYYQAGDVTNALKVMRSLMISRSHGARAAEVVAKLEHERGDLEAAAKAAQIALRAAPDDPKANRNFTRATDNLPEERERKHLESVMKAAEGKDPGAILLAATKDCREVMAASGTYKTNRAERAVALADSLSRRTEKIADAWIPVAGLIAQSVTNEQQAATINAQIAAAQKKTKDAAAKIEDFDPEAYSLLSDAEHDFTRFVKLTVMPPAAMDEDLVAQSNAWMDVEAFNGRSWQQDALDYTRAFRAKFPAWARAYEQQAQSDTNKPPFTAEDQAKISALATELEKLQLECAEKSLPPSQEKSLELINQIRELLPKDPNGGQSQQQNQQQQNQSQQQQNQNQQQQQDQQQDQNQDQQDEGDDDQQQDDQEGEGEEENPEDQEIEAVLKKAQERSDEHEAEKKARMRKSPLAPGERDW